MKKNTEEKSYNKELRSKLFHLLIFFYILEILLQWNHRVEQQEHSLIKAQV